LYEHGNLWEKLPCKIQINLYELFLLGKASRASKGDEGAGRLGDPQKDLERFASSTTSLRDIGIIVFCRAQDKALWTMAPNLAASQHAISRAMLADRRLETRQIAEAVPCSTRTIEAHRANIRLFGTTTAPRNRGGRRRSITPYMLEAVLELLEEQPDLYLDEIADFLFVEYECRVSLPTISRTLKSSGWSKKIPRRRAGEQNQEL
jgi:transposase